MRGPAAGFHGDVHDAVLVPAMVPAVLALGGLVTVICVAESAVILPGAPPKRTTVAPVQPRPGDRHRAAFHGAAAGRGHAGYHRKRDGS